MTTETYKLTTSTTDCPESLGEHYGATFADRASAKQAASEIREDLADAGGDWASVTVDVVAA